MRLVDCFHELFAYTLLLIRNPDSSHPSFSIVKRDLDLLFANADGCAQGHASSNPLPSPQPSHIQPKMDDNWDKPTRLLQVADTPIQEANPYVTIESPKGNSRLDLIKPQIMIGRVATCDLQIQDDLVSRNHASFERRQNGWYLVDRNSSNGTFVNDNRITEQMINNGDVIKIASAKLVFHLPPTTKKDLSKEAITTAHAATQTQEFHTGGDFSIDDYNNAKFAVCAWIDEMILTSSWQGRTEWLKNTLQRRFYNTAIAGEEFIHRLGRLNPNQRAVREVYAYCLALGFSGPYFQEDRKTRSELQIIKQECFQPLLGSNFRENEFWSQPMLPEAYTAAAVQTSTQNKKWHEHVFDRSFLNIALWTAPILLFIILYWIYDASLDGIITNFFQTSL